jgi:hypothetical protein
MAAPPHPHAPPPPCFTSTARPAASHHPPARLQQLMDQRVYNLNGALSRPRAFNNKGTLDENRKVKLAPWSAVYNAFHGLPPPDWISAVYPPDA